VPALLEEREEALPQLCRRLHRGQCRDGGATSRLPPW
jgi:hypothetical protein